MHYLDIVLPLSICSQGGIPYAEVFFVRLEKPHDWGLVRSYPILEAVKTEIGMVLTRHRWGLVVPLGSWYPLPNLLHWAGQRDSL